jgi:Ca2+/Na+ antiporter
MCFFCLFFLFFVFCFFCCLNIVDFFLFVVVVVIFFVCIYFFFVFAGEASWSAAGAQAGWAACPWSAAASVAASAQVAVDRDGAASSAEAANADADMGAAGVWSAAPPTEPPAEVDPATLICRGVRCTNRTLFQFLLLLFLYWFIYVFGLIGVFVCLWGFGFELVLCRWPRHLK